MKLQPNRSLRGRVQVSPPRSLGTGRGHGATSNQRRHRHSVIFRSQRLRELKTGGREVCNSELQVVCGPEMVTFADRHDLQRLRELKACGRVVCTSELQVEYTPETTPEASENIRMVTLLFAGRHDCNAQSWRERGLHQRVAS